MHKLLEQKVSEITEKNTKLTLAQKAADMVADFVGSWKFIIFLCIFLALWMIINIYILIRRPLDPYPFILLNLILSCIAAIQSPLIMMSQNRKQEIDRQQMENDYKVNLKTEIVIEDIHYKLDELLERNEQDFIAITDDIAAVLEQAADKATDFTSFEAELEKLETGWNPEKIARTMAIAFFKARAEGDANFDKEDE